MLSEDGAQTARLATTLRDDVSGSTLGWTVREVRSAEPGRTHGITRRKTTTLASKHSLLGEGRGGRLRISYADGHAVITSSGRGEGGGVSPPF